MKKKRKKERGAKKAGIDAKAVMGEVEKIASGMGYRLRPSAGIAVKNYCRKAVKKRLIVNMDEAITVTSALVAAGVHQAKRSGAKVLKVEDIIKGWRENISLGPGNCPPYYCSKRSILERTEELKEDISEFREFESIRGKSD